MTNTMVFRDLAGLSGYVAGTWAAGDDGNDFYTVRPHDNRLKSVGHRSSTLSDLDRALTAAQSAQRVWGRMPVSERHVALIKAADFIHDNCATLAAHVALEVGKPLNEAIAEVAAAEEFLRYFSSWASWGQHGAVRDTPSGRVMTEKRPRGVVGVVTPWNYPVSNACQKIAAALISGNSVIWRPSDAAPASALMLTHAFDAAGFPAGTLNTLVESGSAVSRALVASESVQAISFTGSTVVGLEVAAAATKRGAAVQCEMGGKNAVAVLADADLVSAATKIANGAFGFAGQRCTAVSRVFVERAVFDEFVASLLEVTASPAFALGDPNVDANCIGPVISASQASKVLGCIDAAVQRGARVLWGAERPSHGPLSYGSYITPTILRIDDRTDPAWRTEFFGPVVVLTAVDDLSDAINRVNDCRYGLAAGVFTQNAQAIWDFIDGVDVGVIKVNEATPGLNPYVPVLGWRESGLGHGELGEEGIDFFTRKKSSYLNDRNK